MVNELKLIFERMDINIWEVIEAANSKPFGFMPFYPGPGMGGHCIPIDPFYLSWKAKEFNTEAKFIELAGEINRKMTENVAHRIGKALNDHSKSIRKSNILILGLAYKKDIDDMRESPALKIIELLRFKGANISCSSLGFKVTALRRFFSAFILRKMLSKTLRWCNFKAP